MKFILSFFFQTINANGQCPTEWRNVYDDLSTAASNVNESSDSFLASGVQDSLEYVLSASNFSHLGTTCNYAGNFLE